MGKERQEIMLHGVQRRILLLNKFLSDPRHAIFVQNKGFQEYLMKEKNAGGLGRTASKY